MPKLLVSVRNSQEAQAALAGGCEILDIKDPSQGSLGRADCETITQILNHTDAFSPAVQTSLALGELQEWQEDVPVSSDWNRVNYLKAGTAGLPDWDTWAIRSRALRAKLEQAKIEHPKWIAVVYVDLIGAEFWAEEVLAVWCQKLCEENTSGVLLDTWDKRAGSLGSLTRPPSAATPQHLTRLLTECRSRQLLCAFAGKLNKQEIETFLNLGVIPDLFAVRSAVCEQQNRLGVVQEKRVRELVSLLHR